MCGLAPSRTLGALKYVAGGWEHCTVRLLPTGKVEVVTGTSPHGQGHETAWSQIASSILGVPVEDIEVIHGDTGRAPYGMDTYGSRSLAVGGQAIKAASERLVDKARVIAAHQLECSPSDLEFVEGVFSVKGDAEKSQPLGAVAFEAFTAHNLPDGVEPTLSAEATIDPQDFSYPHGTHLAAMEVDTETGKVTLRKYVCVDDVGIQVNPMIVEGQVHGGLAQGIAQAMYEGASYDEDGLLQTASLADYLIPSAMDLPSFTTGYTVTPSTTHPLGTKGVGEAGAIASTPAIINGIVDALRPLGVNEMAMPASPMTVWKTIQAAKGGAA
jgi:carbon-monoxide dehydrogenase large subunit